MTDCQCGEHRYTFTRTQLINALARLEVKVAVSGSMAGKVLADSFADVLIEALEDSHTVAPGHTSTVCKGCGGTCCTGVGSQPCTCP